MARLIELLESTRIAECVNEKKDIIELDVDTTLQEALEILARNKILSAPVRDPEAEQEYLGFLDVKDIMVFAMKLYTENADMQQVKWAEWLKDIETLKFRGVDYALKPVGELLNLSKASPWVSVYASGTLFQLIEGPFARGLHRVAVMDENKKIKHIVSQSDLIPYLLSNVKLMDGFARQTVGQLNLGTRSVIFIYADDLAVNAFYMMYFNNVSAVAVVDRTSGQLVATVSSADIRALDLSHWTRLLQPVTVFLQNVRSKSPVTCTLNTNLENVLTRLYIFRVHRLWLVDEEGKPIGVVSLTDVMRLVAEMPRLQAGKNIAPTESLPLKSTSNVDPEATQTAKPMKKD